MFLDNVFHSLNTAFYMFWEVLWPLVLGFFLSAVVQAVVSHKRMSELLGKDSPRCFGLAALFGVASSSCSYAAVALSRSIFRKGATFTSSMIFELASTNLVIELGIILIVLMGWQFALAEYFGGIIMVIIIALIFRVTLSKKLIERAKNESGKGLMGKMEGHAQMDMSLEKGTMISKIFSKAGFTAISHYFAMNWYSVWIDIVLGFLIAGVLAIFVPSSFWRTVFLTNNPQASFIEGPLVGPLIAIVSFVCSVGNIPLAAVLWREGISFGGVASFIFADLIVLPILDIYRKYYGWRVMLYILATFYIAMAFSGYVIEIIFSALKIIPTNRNIQVMASGVAWNYTTVLNIISLIFAAVLIYRFIKTGGMGMIKMMNMNHN